MAVSTQPPPVRASSRPARAPTAAPTAGVGAAADIDGGRAARRQARARRRERIAAVALPIVLFAALLALWEVVVQVNRVSPSALPAPSLVVETLVKNWGSLAPALWSTAQLTITALGAAVLGGVLLAVAFAGSKWVQISLLPVAVVLQVTPIVAIAPLVLLYLDSTAAALLVCTWVVALFPILSNTVTGLKSADGHLRDLYSLYGATPWQRLRFLIMPSALPHFLGGLKAAGGLALVAAVVAEFTAASVGRHTGLGSRILDSMLRTEVAMMFAALALVSLLGIALFVVLAVLAHLLLGHWHESESRRET